MKITEDDLIFTPAEEKTIIKIFRKYLDENPELLRKPVKPKNGHS